MGQEIVPTAANFVTFEPSNDHFAVLISLDGLLRTEADPEPFLQRLGDLYASSVSEMRGIVQVIKGLRASRSRIPARLVWALGDVVLRLVNDLAQLSLELDDLYHHLTRDLAVNRKWLEKVIILRRYIPDRTLIPESLSWGRCEKGTKAKAQKIALGLPVLNSESRD